MSSPAIRVEGLSKEYRIGGARPTRSLRESITNGLAMPFRKTARLLRGQATGASGLDESFWALRDVSFEIPSGQVVGIIGRNGAGKSTLLKVLSRITTPTHGSVLTNGRIGALLEVGTGFHSELTGRENVYLSGSILGMSRGDIRRNFDDIVEFAGVERFIETPVKHYSTGMYLRLAFSVAAHLEPDILVVDEVLAVGDAGFQKRCLNKMEEVGQGGRTVLFVSHSMPTITRLCSRAILLDGGSVAEDGPATQVVGNYLRSDHGTTAERTWREGLRPGNSVARLRRARVRDAAGETTETLDIRRPVGVEMEYDVLEGGRTLVPNILVHNEDGVEVFCSCDPSLENRRGPRPPGRYRSIAWIPGNFLAEGRLIVTVGLTTMDPLEDHFFERDAVSFQVVDSIDGDSARGDFAGRMPGVVRPLLDWTTESVPAVSSEPALDSNGVIA